MIAPYLFPEWIGRRATIIRMLVAVALVVGWIVFMYRGPSPLAGLAMIVWVAIIAWDWTVLTVRLVAWLRARRTGGTLQGPRPATEVTP